MIDGADPDFVAPDFGTDEAVLQHPFRLAFRVHIRAGVDGHDERKSPVFPIKMNAIFATKSHTLEIKASATNWHHLIWYVFAQMPRPAFGPEGLLALRTGGGARIIIPIVLRSGASGDASLAAPLFEGQMAFVNQVLARLSDSDLALLQPHLEPVELGFRQSIEKPGKAIPCVIFPDEGIVSVVANGQKGSEVEVGIIGFDSMTAQSVVMGTDRSPNSTYVQVAGRGRRMKIDVFRSAIAGSATLHRSLLAVVQSFIIQASSTALANGRSTVAARLARWLLMAHDRVDGDAIPLTHEFLAVMLGVRRAGVTTALSDLDARGCIAAKRGSVVVRNRKELVALARGIYGVAEAEQERLTGWKPAK